MTKFFKSIWIVAFCLQGISCEPHINPVDEHGGYNPSPDSTNPTPNDPNHPNPIPNPNPTMNWKEVTVPALSQTSFKKLWGVMSNRNRNYDLFLITSGTNDSLLHFKGNDFSQTPETLLTDYHINDVNGGSNLSGTNDVPYVTATGYSATAPDPYDRCFVFNWTADPMIPALHTGKQIIRTQFIWPYGDNPTMGPTTYCQEQKAVLAGSTPVTVGDDGTFMTGQFPWVEWTNLFSYDSMSKRVFHTNPLKAIWTKYGNEYWAMATNGTLYHTKRLNPVSGREGWTPISVTTNTLNAIAGATEWDIMVVGEKGTLVHYDGTKWKTLSVPEVGNTNLTSIFALPTGEYYIGGENGKFFSFINGVWTAQTLSTTETILSIFAFSTKNVYAVTKSKIFQYLSN